MASSTSSTFSEPPSPKLLARDIAAFSNAELNQYLDKIRLPSGKVIIDVEGWEDLPKDQQESLVQRLRVQAHNASEVATSRPVDLGQVTARLLEISADNNILRRPSNRPFDFERSPTPPLPTKEELREFEMEFHHALISNGGRPWYPIHLLENISEDPEEYRELLAFWRSGDTDWWVFDKQLRRWQDFRDWQRYVRGIPVDDGFPEYAETMKRILAKDPHLVHKLSDLELDKKVKRMWEGGGYEHRWKLLGARVVGGFPAHVETVKRRLAQHGFTRTFQLEEDPKRQNKVTTWIEYLNYEYWWYDRYASSVKRQQPLYDEAWKKLVDSKVLRPFETEQYILSDAWGFQQEGEEGRARNAVKSAEAAAKEVLVSTQTYPQRSSHTKPERVRMLAEVTSRLDRTRESLKSVKRRGDLIGDFRRETRDFRGAKKDAERHTILLQWILEQFPLVEAEFKESEAAESSLNVTHGTKRLRRDQDEALKDRSAKRQRRNNQASSISNDGITTALQLKEKSKRGRHKDTIDDEPPPKRSRFDNRGSNPQREISGSANEPSIKGTVSKSNKVLNGRRLRSTRVPQSSVIPQQHRRSPRIAARQGSSGIAVPPPHAAKSSRQSSHRKVLQAPTPPSSTGSQDHQSRPSATKPK